MSFTNMKTYKRKYLTDKPANDITKTIDYYRTRSIVNLEDEQSVYIPTLQSDPVEYQIDTYVMGEKRFRVRHYQQICFKLKHLKFKNYKWNISEKYKNTNPNMNAEDYSYIDGVKTENISKYYERNTPMKELVDKGIIYPFALFVEGLFIPWHQMSISISDNGVYLIVDINNKSEDSIINIIAGSEKSDLSPTGYVLNNDIFTPGKETCLENDNTIAMPTDTDIGRFAKVNFGEYSEYFRYNGFEWVKSEFHSIEQNILEKKSNPSYVQIVVIPDSLKYVEGELSSSEVSVLGFNSDGYLLIGSRYNFVKRDNDNINSGIYASSFDFSDEDSKYICNIFDENLLNTDDSSGLTADIHDFFEENNKIKDNLLNIKLCKDNVLIFKDDKLCMERDSLAIGTIADEIDGHTAVLGNFNSIEEVTYDPTTNSGKYVSIDGILYISDGIQWKIYDEDQIRIVISKPDEDLGKYYSASFKASMMYINSFDSTENPSSEPESSVQLKSIVIINPDASNSVDNIYKFDRDMINDYIYANEDTESELISDISEPFNLEMDPNKPYSKNRLNAIRTILEYDSSAFNNVILNTSNLEITEYTGKFIKDRIRRVDSIQYFYLPRRHSEMSEEYILMLVNGELYTHSHAIIHRAGYCMIPIIGINDTDIIEFLRFKNVNNTVTDLVVDSGLRNVDITKLTSGSMTDYNVYINKDISNYIQNGDTVALDIIYTDGLDSLDKDITITGKVTAIREDGKAIYINAYIEDYYLGFKEGKLRVTENHGTLPGYSVYNPDYINNDMLIFSNIPDVNTDPYEYPYDGKQYFPIDFEIVDSYENKSDKKWYALIELHGSNYIYYDKTLKVAHKNRFVHKQYRIPDSDYVQYCIDLTSDFSFCYDYNKYLVFYNGRKIDSKYYRLTIPADQDTPFYDFKLYFSMPVNTNDKIDIVYVPSLMMDIVCEDTLDNPNINVPYEVQSPYYNENGELIIQNNVLKEYGLGSELYIFWINGKKIAGSNIRNIDSDHLAITSTESSIYNFCVTKFIPGVKEIVDIFKDESYKSLWDSIVNNIGSKIHSLLGIEIGRLLPTGDGGEDNIYNGAYDIEAVMNHLIREQYVMNPYVDITAPFIYGYKSEYDIDTTSSYGTDDSGNILFKASDADDENINIAGTPLTTDTVLKNETPVDEEE